MLRPTSAGLRKLLSEIAEERELEVHALVSLDHTKDPRADDREEEDQTDQSHQQSKNAAQDSRYLAEDYPDDENQNP
jgi:hypothetical protein